VRLLEPLAMLWIHLYLTTWLNALRLLILQQEFAHHPDLCRVIGFSVAES
jgi:hypothetical protein